MDNAFQLYFGMFIWRVGNLYKLKTGPFSYTGIIMLESGGAILIVNSTDNAVGLLTPSTPSFGE